MANTWITIPSPDGFVLTMVYHELGHLCGNSDNVGNNALTDACVFHTSYCSGKNELDCLWQYCFATDPLLQTQTYIEDYLGQFNFDPKFCEGHQQIFTNQFRPQK